MWAHVINICLLALHTQTHWTLFLGCVVRSVTSKFRTCSNGADMRNQSDQHFMYSHFTVASSILFFLCGILGDFWFSKDASEMI